MKKYISFLLLIFIIPFNVYALTGNVSMKCPTSTVSAGDTVSCTVMGNASEIVDGVEAQVNISGDGNIDAFLYNNELWLEGGIKSSDIIYSVISKGDKVTGDFVIGTLKLNILDTAKDSVSVSFSNITFVDNDSNDVTEGITSEGITFTVSGNAPVNNDDGNANKNNTGSTPTPNSTPEEKQEDLYPDVYLKDISISGYKLKFDKDVLNYELKIKDETSLNIKPVLIDSIRYEYEIDGNSNLENGSIITIAVFNEELHEKVYTIKIIKETNDKNKNDCSAIFIVIIIILIGINIYRIIKKRKQQ